MRFGHVSTLGMVLMLSLSAKADTIATFNFSGNSVFYGLGGDQNLVNGMTTIDTTTGVVQSISFTAGGVFQTGVDSQFGPIVYVGAAPSKISFDAGSLINYAGSAFDINGPNDLYVGHTTLGSPAAGMANAPEPSSILLLSTGLLGIAGVARRRFCHNGERLMPVDVSSC